MSIFSVVDELESIASKVEGEVKNAFLNAFNLGKAEIASLEAWAEKLRAHGYTVVSPVTPAPAPAPVETPPTV